jgi:hypothetical protein
MEERRKSASPTGADVLPAPEVILLAFACWPVALRRPASPTTNTVAPKPMLN